MLLTPHLSFYETKMYYVYLLQSIKNKEIYIGSTPDLRKRFLSHNKEKNFATKDLVPWKIIYYEAYSLKKFALIREKQLKRYGKGLAMLKKRIGFQNEG